MRCYVLFLRVCLIVLLFKMEHGCFIQKGAQQHFAQNALIDAPRSLTWSRTVAKHIEDTDVQKDARHNSIYGVGLWKKAFLYTCEIFDLFELVVFNE